MPDVVRRRSTPARTGWRIRAGLLALLLAFGALAIAHGSQGRAAADVPDVALTSLGTFASPLYVTSPPGDPTRIFVVERGGTVRVLKNGALLPTPFINVTDEVGEGGERGLLSLAFAPDYAISGLVYTFATQPNGTLVVLGAPRRARRRRRGRRPPPRPEHPAPGHQPQRRPAPVRPRRLPLHR